MSFRYWFARLRGVLAALFARTGLDGSKCPECWAMVPRNAGHCPNCFVRYPEGLD